MYRYCFLLFLSCSISVGSAQQYFTAGQCSEDFEIFRKSLEEGHPGLYTYFNTEQIAKVFEKTESAISKGANGHVLHREFLECISAIRDGHTAINYPATWNGYMGMQHLLPFHFSIRDGQVFILEDCTGKNRVEPGSEVIAVNGIDAITLQQRLNKHTPNDGNVQHYKNNYNGRFLSKRLMYLYPACTNYELRLKTPVGEEITIVVQGISETKLYPADKREQLSFVIEDAAATLTVRSFNLSAIERGGQHYFEFMESAFKTLRKEKIPNLIIDVRDNGGGDNDLAIALYTYLSLGDFAYINPEEGNNIDKLTFASHAKLRTSRTQWSAAPDSDEASYEPAAEVYDGLRIYNLTEQRFEDISKNKFSGRLQVLTNPATFSSASIFAAVCQGNSRGELVGEGTGEACDSFCGGGAIRVTLPHSGLILTIPRQKASIANAHCLSFGREVRPDVFVAPSLSDRIAERDVVLGAALSRIK